MVHYETSNDFVETICLYELKNFLNQSNVACPSNIQHELLRRILNSDFPFMQIFICLEHILILEMKINEAVAISRQVLKKKKPDRQTYRQADRQTEILNST